MNLREWALPVYTILIQLAVGTLLVLWLIRRINMERVGGPAMDRILRKPVLIMFFTILVAIIGSHFHLSNPLLSFMAVLNVKHSWLSREIVFTVLTFFACAALVDRLWKQKEGGEILTTTLGWIVIILGYAAIFCMASIYILPTQAPWNHWSTILQFYASSLLLGPAAATALLVMDAIFSQEYDPELTEPRLQLITRSLGMLTGIAACALILIFGLNAAQIMGPAYADALAQISLSLLLGLYQPLLMVRLAVLCAALGTLILVTYRLVKKSRSLTMLITPVYLACLLALVAEILGRFLFYASHVRLGL